MSFRSTWPATACTGRTARPVATRALGRFKRDQPSLRRVTLVAPSLSVRPPANVRRLGDLMAPDLQAGLRARRAQPARGRVVELVLRGYPMLIELPAHTP